MPRYFLTKVWGFSPDDYPVLGFPPGGGCNKFLKESHPDDWVVMAGTKGAETAAAERGRLLGMVRLGRNLLSVEDVLNSLGTPIPPEHRRPNGEYKWPTGLPMVEARRFVDTPDLASIFGNYLPGQEWAAFALDLAEKVRPDVVARLAALPTEPVDITASPIIAAQASVSEALRLNRETGPTGPGPSNHRDAVDRTPAWGSAYLLRLEGPPNWQPHAHVVKIGRAEHVEKRLKGLNHGLVTGATGFSWGTVLEQRFATEKLAHAFEQAMHELLRPHRVKGQSEVYAIRQSDAEAAWVRVFKAGRWGVGEGT